MKMLSPGLAICVVLFSSAAARAELVAPAFYGEPPDEHHPWCVHDRNRPEPKVVTPGTFSTQEQPGKPPSDAIILFDGDLSKWESAKDGSAAKWSAKDGILEVTPKTGDIRTRDQFGDCQLHVEWAEPPDVQGSSQGRGNSGIFLMGLVEIQVLDVYHNATYADGGAGSVYGQHPAMANALRPPGEFQVYDIIFRRPIYKNKKLVDAGYVTVFVNGVVVQDHALLEGPTGHMKRAEPEAFPEKGPLELQDHGNPVKFRNIWYRPLPPRISEGSTDGYLSPEATMAKRKQIAAEVRENAAALQAPVPHLLREMESLVYEKDPATVKNVERDGDAYVASLKQLPAEQLNSKKDEAKHVSEAFNYLVHFKILPESFGPSVELKQLIKQHGWNKR